MNYEIIDFHTHPFPDADSNICSHKEFIDMGPEQTKRYLTGLGISRICGSVIYRDESRGWEKIRKQNDAALMLREYFGGFYIPGFHVHPDYVKESVAEIHRMKAEGVNLIGELVPYMDDWNDYSCAGFSESLDEAAACGMVVSFHSMGEDEMDRMVEAHPDTVFIAAHPGEYGSYLRHFARMRMSRNYYLDLSGYGLFRHGMLRRGIDEYGVSRFIFGSDYPTCSPAMYIGGVLLDTLITDEEKKQIFSENIKRILKL